MREANANHKFSRRPAIALASFVSPRAFAAAGYHGGRHG